jgi:hypothetical protein
MASVPEPAPLLFAPLQLAIRYKNLNEHLLRFVVQSAEQGHYQMLIDQGMDPTLHDRLRALSAEDMQQLALNQPLFSVTLDQAVAARLIHGLDARKEENRQLTYFVSRGATTDFLRRHFHASATRITEYRAILSPSRRGRPPRPADEEVAAIVTRWQALRADCPRQRDRYEQLARDYPQYSIATLAAIVDETETETALTRGQLR